MSTTTETPAAHEPGHDAEHAHPPDSLYVQIAIILAVLTAAEVATYVGEVSDALGDFMIPALLGLMVIKFSLVVMFFMHLRFDHRLFSWVFVGGVALAVGVYIAALATFEFWA